ncbi:MAG: hypothetical protein HRT38_12835 [Alteromonadaceae bacterium]|nr:hypothetical protein [Alteromonadaceae bacterium]
MQKYRLSFAHINIINNQIAEIIVDDGVVVSLEMVEEHDDFLTSIFDGEFGILVNKINNYHYSPEAQLIMGSIENIVAVAVVNYTTQDKQSSKEIIDKRFMDQLNIKIFSGLELGRQQAITWLQQELANISTN